MTVSTVRIPVNFYRQFHGKSQPNAQFAGESEAARGTDARLKCVQYPI